MTTPKFNKYIKQWKEGCAIDTGIELEPECICIEEVCRSTELNLNRSYYQCIIKPDNSKTGVVCTLLYSSVDLLEIDEQGDIISAETLDYQVIS